MDDAELLRRAVKFAFGAGRDTIYVERRFREEGPETWAVTDAGLCLNSDAEWEYEPMPSGRDEEYLHRTRFSLAEALALAAWAEGQR